MTLNDLNNSLQQLASKQDRESILDFAFALMGWLGIEANSGNTPQLLAPKTQKLKDYLENAPKTVQSQLYRLSADNQPIRIRFAVLKKLKKDYISQLVDNDPGAESYQNTPAPLRSITKAPYFIHFVATPAYDKLILIFNHGDQKRVVSFRSRLTNTQYNKIIQQWQGIANKNKTEIADLFWKSLDIKEVNKEFYKQIKERFDALIGIVRIQSSKATENQVKQFTVRMIGRYIFCWFLKEKGIISQDLIGKKSVETTKNFYQNVLLKLFFETLNTKVQDRNPLTHEKLFEKIPYLNGGLFDESDEDRLFRDLKLDDWLKPFVEILESYDFTVDESNSQYQQVAVDPEMLGRIFENLLASQNEETEKLANQRKAFGAFYTPREIVDYMVNESIKAYLASSLSIKDEELVAVFAANPAWPEKLKTKKSDALTAIENIKILDPACGSGAFPMGILHKLVELHELLGTVKSSYELKKDILSQNIYGVDIMPMAIEIARLRAWLSLVLEEDYKPNDPKHNFGVKPLPNLDFKFVCANSLVDSGFDTLYNKYIADVNIPRAASMVNLAREIPELIKIRNQYFDAALKNKKKEEIIDEYESKKNQIKKDFSTLRRSFKEVDTFLENIDQWNPFDENKISPFFSPTWMFGVDKGFDIVIGNPPYGISIKKSENP
ncbi:MAG TPA: DNA methyltransferase, partial [Cyclobacteriaceae bacterium]|nr:DNA methyltransferase [Cyclobacteriaceae bacterium]